MENSKYIRTGENTFYKNTEPKGFLGGAYVMTEGEASEEEIALMKEKVLDDICNEIRKIATEHEDFFFIKTGARFPGLDNEIVTTVGARYLLPTVNN